MTFQKQVNVQPAPAVAGDFASSNPRFNVLAGPGGLVAGAAGVTVGRFAWATNPDDADGAPAVVSNTGFGPVTGFVHRNQQALITAYLAESSNLIQAGFQMALMSGGDVWVKNDGTGECVPGMKAYANFADGKATFAATGTPTNSATSTASSIAAETNSATASITDDVMTATAVTGTLVAGTQLSGSGVATGTEITSQVTPLLAGETLGGVGRYIVSIGDQAVASTTISGTYGLLTVGGTLTGTWAVGQLLSGSGVTAGTYIRQLGTGTGGAGTYYVNLTQTVGSETINAVGNVETKWIAMSAGQAGELVKISSHALG